jgi:dTDP-4-amino-4,6-dideoxygalactose transaminase
MTDLQAAIGLVELERYEDTLERRKSIFDQYSAGFSSHDWAIIPTYETESKISSYHLYMLRVKGISEAQRDEIINEIGQHQVAVNVHYIPIPMLTFYKSKGYDISNYPIAYQNFSCEITLPVFYNLTDEQVNTVITTVTNAVKKYIN